MRFEGLEMRRREVLSSGFGIGLLALGGRANAEAPQLQRLLQSAHAQTRQSVTYDGSYRTIAYPMGDVPSNIGVCSDVLIRAYRAIGIDLQQSVHEDMAAHFSLYPRTWGLKSTDKNIDHRRVPNLEVFFARHGQRLKISKNAADFRAGDIVSYRLSGGLPHIALVSDEKAWGQNRPMIIHNIGAGPKQEDDLFGYEMVGHYRYAV